MDHSGSSKWIVALTGASGMPYALRLLDVLSQTLPETHVIVSEAALRVLAEEQGLKVSQSKLSARELLGSYLRGSERSGLVFHNPRDIGAAPASGSALFEGMVIVPCSMSTLGAIAAGVPQNLIHRAADVTLKEGRRLILVPRETPLSAIHLENMLKLSRLGVSITAAMPGFYSQPAGLSDIVDMMVMKILDQMRIPNELARRWTGGSAKASASSNLLQLKGLTNG